VASGGAARSDRVLFCAALILAAQSPLSAQEVRVSSRPYAPSPFVLRVDTNLVETGVVVRDYRGHAIAGLTQGDFKIFDDGKEREITAFSVETSASARKSIATASGVAPASPAATEQPPQPPSATPVIEPRYVALLFDDVHTRHGDLAHARVAAERFVREALQPGDRVAIFTTSGTRVLAFTADTAKLIGGIEKLSEHPRMDENGVAPCPRITPYQAYLIVSLDPSALHAAMDEANSCLESPSNGHGEVSTNITTTLAPGSQAVRVQAEQTWDQVKTISQGTLDAIGDVVDELAKMPGGRVLLLASSGFLAETLEYDQSRIIDKARAANVVINALDAKGLFSETSVRTPEQLENLSALPLSTATFEVRTQLSALETANTPLINLAQSTGGLFFHNSNDLTLGFRELAAVPEISYRLGFRPGEGGQGRYHKLQVKLIRPGSNLVQARRGYFAPAKGTEPASTPRQKLDREVSAGGVMADFAASVKVEPGKSDSGQPLLWVSVHVDLQHLPFTKRDDHHLQGLVFVTSLLDANGNVVTAKEGRMDLELTEATLARLTKTGVNARLSLEAPPGTYRLREVVQEAVGGKMAASNRDVRID
jgi:VWFA-related protein